MIQHFAPRPAVFEGAPAMDHVLCSRRFPQKAEARIKPWMEALSQAYNESYGANVDLTKLPMNKQRQLAGMAENTLAHHSKAIASHRADMLFRVSEGVSGNLGFHNLVRDLREATSSSDIATFTTQQLAFVTDVFADFIVDEVFTQIVMNGPSAFVHTQQAKREDASDFYDADSALVDGLDPSYSDDPGDCTEANGIDLEVTSSLVEAEVYRMAAAYCIPANYHYTSQYGGDLPAALNDAGQIEFRRHLQSRLLSHLVSNAGDDHSWNQTPEDGSYFESAHPREWKKELWRTVKIANRAMLSAVNGRVPGTHLLGDVSAIGILEDIPDVEFVDNQPADVNFGRGDEKSEFLGTIKGSRYRVMRVIEGMAADTMLLMNRNDSDPTAVFAPWLPVTSLGALTYPTKARVEMGWLTMYGMTVLRPNRIQSISIGD